mgnify:CR=1 FL=1
MEDKKSEGLTGELNSGVKYESSAGGRKSTQPNQDEAAKEFEKLKGKLEELKKKILSKYKFTRFLSILPANSLPLLAEDENIAKEIESSKPMLLMMCIPEENYKELPKIKQEIVKLVQESKQNVWVLFKTEVDLWNYGLDSKYELLDFISASFPLHDNGFLGSLRVANIHKTLVLRKFEKYVASYAIGGSLVRGTAGKDSDVDTFVIIDDTDVKRMPRLELKEKLRGMIYDYIREATALAGVKNILNVQVYLLTEFWESVKDAQPVMFTFIRDGIPLYDRGTFLPWKLLLKMGKIKPSPEAIDMFMKSGEQTTDLIKRRMIDAMIDIYFGVVTPTQALMMLAGHAPPEPKIIVSEVKKVLVDKEKLMSSKELKILEKVVRLYKDYEHGKLNEISGKEIDELKKESDEYAKSMRKLREDLELRMREHTAEKVNDEVFSLLRNIFGNKSQEALISELEKELVKKGKIKARMLNIAREIANVKRKAKSKKISQAEMQKISSEASELITALIEFAQRKELIAIEKSVLQVSYDDGKKAEIVLTDLGVFVVLREGVKKISGRKLLDSNREELEKALAETKDKMKGKLSSEVLEVLRKEFGEFEIGF